MDATQFASVQAARKANDHLSLKVNTSVKKMMNKYDKTGTEDIQFSDFIVKINPKENPQERVLLITNAAIYNLLPTNYGKCKRRVGLEGVSGVTVSQISDEFVIHIPAEYDYRLMSLRKREVLGILQRNFQEFTGNPLPVNYVDKIVLKDCCTTKSQAKKNKKKGVLSNSFVPQNPQPAASTLPPAIPEEAKVEHGAPAMGRGGSGGGDYTTSTAYQRARSETVGMGGAKSNVCVEDFELLKVIGRGSFGKVMQVRKKAGPDAGSIFAMKILRKEAIIERNQVEHTKAEREILEEIDHPFLMKMHYAFQTAPKLYFVMTMITGGELFFHLKNDRRFSEPRACLYTAEILLGLGHLHSKDIIYRDLKPENILLDDIGHVILTDFGLSKKFTKPGEKAQTFCGTPEYLAPEVVMGVGHGKEVDWWSLGILLFEMLVGLPPFYSENTNLMYELIQKADLRIPGYISYDARDLLKKLLKHSPLERLGTGDGDMHDIMAHAFFKDINFDALMRREIRPEFQPTVKSATDTSNFDAEFTDEQVVDSMAPTSRLVEAKANQFNDFTYKEKGAMG